MLKQLNKIYSVNIQHGRFCRATSDFTNSHHKTKNPKRVAAGKAIAQKTKQAREAQKKALIDAQSMIAAKVNPPSNTESATLPESTESILTTTQWLSVISIFVSLVGIYYKREEIKKLLTKKPPQDYTPPPVPPNSPEPKRSIKKMD